MKNRTINLEEVKEFYNNLDEIWDKDDKWHTYTNRYITQTIKSWYKKYSLSNKNYNVANIGSGGNNYSIEQKTLHVDIAEKNIHNFTDFLVANAEKLPLDNEIFDLVICVGSVINYCDASKVIDEISRITKKGGYIILEFENSLSFLYSGFKNNKRNIEYVKTTYQDKEHSIYTYSLKYILNNFTSNNVEVIANDSFHILSSLISYVTCDESKSVKYTKFDNTIKKMRYFNNRSNNMIILLKKI